MAVAPMVAGDEVILPQMQAGSGVGGLLTGAEMDEPRPDAGLRHRTDLLLEPPDEGHHAVGSEQEGAVRGPWGRGGGRHGGRLVHDLHSSGRQRTGSLMLPLAPSRSWRCNSAPSR